MIVVRSLRNDTEIVVGDARDYVGDLEEGIGLAIFHAPFLGKYVPWDEHAALYRDVLLPIRNRLVPESGVLFSAVTDSYRDGGVLPRARLCENLFVDLGLRLIDRKIWKRRRSDLYQVPFTEIGVFVRSDSTYRYRYRFRLRLGEDRPTISEDPEYREGIWDFPASERGSQNAFPARLCSLVVRSFSKSGDLVVDPFAGTGAVVAEAGARGRRAIGFEIDEGLVNGIVEKLEPSEIVRRSSFLPQPSL